MTTAIFRYALLLTLLCFSSLSHGGPVPIWDIQTANNRFILMGSVHYLRPSDYPLPAAFDQVFDDADVLLMEIDMDSMDQMQSMLQMEQTGKHPSGKGLKEMIGASRYREVAMRAEALGIPMMLLDDKEPWYAGMLVSQLRLLASGFQPGWGIEVRFSQKAAMAGKEINGLETLEEQLAALDTLSLDTQTDFLLESLNPQQETDEEMQQVLRAWKTGDEQLLADTMHEGMATMPELYESLLVERNIKWARTLEQLDQRNQSKTFLVVVGAMHLVGKDSVQQQWYGVSAKQLRE